MTDLPDPPWRVLAYKYIGREPPAFPAWYSWSGDDGQFYDCDYERQESDYYEGMYHDWKAPDEMVLIDHPRNDPEAVEIIRKAKEQNQ